MKAKITMKTKNKEPIVKYFDWEDEVKTKDGLVKVHELSFYKHKLIFDGLVYEMLHIHSQKAFSC